MKKNIKTKIKHLKQADGLKCPCCNQVIIDFEKENSKPLPCKHTLFIATDEGFEYRSKSYKDLQKEKIGKHGEESFHDYTNNIPIDGAVKVIFPLAQMPCCLDLYVGFAPEISTPVQKIRRKN